VAIIFLTPSKQTTLTITKNKPKHPVIRVVANLGKAIFAGPPKIKITTISQTDPNTPNLLEDDFRL
jgi:hypothetical protein